jgi:DNA-binding HxlR family transcriptional regulator
MNAEPQHRNRPGLAVRGSKTGRPIMALFDLAGRRWALRVLWELSEAGESLTFRELKSRCADMSSSVLSRRVAELREALLVDRHNDGYRLSPLGTELVAGLQPLLDWSRTWAMTLQNADGE